MKEKGKRLSEDEKEYILQHYKTKCTNQIAADIGFKCDAVIRYLKKEGRYEEYKTFTFKQKKMSVSRHNKMLSFAKKLGFKNTAEAIQKYGSREFIRMFKNQ